MDNKPPSDIQACLLMGCELRFMETGNPIFAIEALLIAHEEQWPIPQYVADWLAEAFWGYLDVNNKKTLDKLLGLASPGKGQRPALKKFDAEQLDFNYAHEMSILKARFNVTTAEAAYMVACRIDENPKLLESKNRAFKKLSADTLEDRYSREWYKEFEHHLSSLHEKSLVTEKDRERYLRCYPSHSIPTGLK